MAKMRPPKIPEKPVPVLSDDHVRLLAVIYLGMRAGRLRGLLRLFGLGSAGPEVMEGGIPHRDHSVHNAGRRNSC
jgi:hypothetical protein